MAAGVWVAAMADRLLTARAAGAPLTGQLAAPWRRASLLLVQQQTTTERPDVTLWRLAPAMYGAMAATIVVPVPLTEGAVAADVRTGIVLIGAAEVGAMVAIFLNGWSANSYPALVGAYRILAMGLSYVLLSMFVLIAAALPAESLSVGAIVASQEPLWNVVRQPLGLPLWLIVGLGVAFWGPLELPDGRDLGGGTAAETAGAHRLVWELSRYAMLVAYAVVGAAVFLGGHHGPLLPGWAWMAVKSLGLLVALVASRQVVGRVPPERFVLWTWTVLLPLAFLDLLIAGLEALP
ncbi:MAG: NADH-quinone oxidoreductase subunit H [Actinobacteria bacterium]|nr:NADH-quinone oxidoreductase subunit H [Actinomycetota bacterium]